MAGRGGGEPRGAFLVFICIRISIHICIFFSLKIGGHPVAKWDSWWGWGGEEEELRAQGTEGG